MPFSNVYFLFFFLADMFAHEEGGPEPDWVKTERDQFSDFRDLNKDGKMDQEEIRQPDTTTLSLVQPWETSGPSVTQLATIVQ